MSAPARPYLGRTGTGVTAGLLLLVAGVALIAALVLPVNQLTQPGGSVAVTLTGAEEEPLDVGRLPEGVAVADSSPDAVLSAFELPAGLRALTELPASMTLLAIAGGCYLLARLVAPLTGGLVATAVLEHLDLADPGAPFALLSTTVSLTPVAVAVVLLAGAEAFRRGGALEREVEGMV